MNARAVALDLLRQWDQSPSLADDLLSAHPGIGGLSGADRALAIELFYGVLRRRSALDHIISLRAVKRPRAPVAQALQLGLYQLLYTDKIPVHAAVHETVEIAKQTVNPSEIRFVNALLRRVSESVEATRQSLETIRAGQPWTYHSHPQWLWTRWEQRLGREQTEALCAWNNTPPPMYARVNTLRPQSDPLPDGLDPEPQPMHPLCRRLTDPGALLQSPAWKAGGYYIQDPSTLVAVDLLDPQPGEAILDMCAAPGGKTTYIAQKMGNEGRIIAADSSSSRLGRVAENCQRLGVSIVATIPCEGTRLDRCLRGDRFDRVLVDAPCSNTGVLRRRADLRWRIEPSEIKRLAALQRKLLAAARQFVRPGGVLVYSTCSIEPEENDDAITAFQQAHPDVKIETTRILFPPRDNMDGAFCAKIRV
jgi:16S rRNA (cytosine967-C5)-methyltransferase